MTEAFIYSIKCLETGDVYIGSTIRHAIRWNGHRFDLKHNRHSNQSLQDDWNRYGETAFSFMVIEVLTDSTKADLRRSEALWIEKIGTYNKWIGKNGILVPNAEVRAGMVKNTKRRWKEGDPSLIAGHAKALEVAHAGHSERLIERWQNPEYTAKMIAVSHAVLTPEHQKAATETRWAQDGAHEHQSAKLTEAWKSREKKSGLPRGVTHIPNSDRFKASMWKDGKNKHLGCFGTIEEAAAAYQAAIA